MWKPRKKGYTIGRLIWVPRTTGEMFYLRMMITVVKGPMSYEDIREVRDLQCETFRDACFAMGFLEDDREYIGAIKEASEWGSGHYLRKLFVIMLLSGDVNRSAHVWSESWVLLSDGILHTQWNLVKDKELVLNEEQLQNLTLIEIEILLYVLKQLGNMLIYEERSYNIQTMKDDFVALHATLTDEERGIYHKIMKAITTQNGGVFFLYGYGGTDKTYMWRTLASAIRSKHDICLTIATSGIALLLLPGGRTAHSRFKIPVPTLDNSTCNITYLEESADLLREAKLIIWDEAPMANKWCFEALDKTLRDLMSAHGNSDNDFGGKVVVFGGDFR
ncbi:uncharacterized protein LOC131636152 [Vicia villosa]|uniref:uncharacterized protein LOC131636152 n=1 Tax=Vicia villosa TaxID=3911 RepID=UPI00273AE32E|nr:uncharacterized protein LOC131636152 [Vicia villosa]